MSAAHDQHRGEESPLLRPMAQNAAGALCTCGVIGVLAFSWCVLDFWNRTLSNDLFNIGDVRIRDVTDTRPGSNSLMAPFKAFTFPLTLAFVQFVFMAFAFLGAHWIMTKDRPTDLDSLKLTTDKKWPALVGTHVFSTFWLQSLMMPAQAMSLALFAASRAVEIPLVAALRAPVLGVRFGEKTMQTTALAFASACILYFAYAEMEGCLCIMSGNGVALAGVAFWVIYGLILAMPAANAVCQEAILKQLGTHPLLILGLQNALAALIFTPILLISHLFGWEDIAGGFRSIIAYQEVFMLVMWLCAQIAMTSVVCIMLIAVADSFWAIALRALRVMFWALTSLMTFYMSNTTVPLSIASPRQSMWAFVICCGGGLAAVAIFTDKKAMDDVNPGKDGCAAAGMMEEDSGKASA